MNNNEQQQPKITDEEVWLRAYSATFSDHNISYNGRIDSADMCLYNFKQRFRQNERT